MKISNLIILIIIGLIVLVWGVSFTVVPNKPVNWPLGGDTVATKVLTTTEKAAVNSLITKQASGKMTYSEYLNYVKALNDNTTARIFKIEKTLNEVLPILKSELSAKAK